MRLPRAWTDADGPPPDHDHAPATEFTVESLRALMALVAALEKRG
jgi:hypothetical protein